MESNSNMAIGGTVLHTGWTGITASTRHYMRIRATIGTPGAFGLSEL